jgi:hypothetical protein
MRRWSCCRHICELITEHIVDSLDITVLSKGAEDTNSRLTTFKMAEVKLVVSKVALSLVVLLDGRNGCVA